MGKRWEVRRDEGKGVLEGRGRRREGGRTKGEGLRRGKWEEVRRWRERSDKGDGVGMRE